MSLWDVINKIYMYFLQSLCHSVKVFSLIKKEIFSKSYFSFKKRGKVKMKVNRLRYKLKINKKFNLHSISGITV